jgi:hypothetical protein
MSLNYFVRHHNFEADARAVGRKATAAPRSPSAPG